MPSLELHERWRTTADRLSKDAVDAIKKQAIEIMNGCDPLLPHIVEVKLVRNQRKNFLNIRIQNSFMKIFHFSQNEDTFVCYSPVFNFQPHVRVFLVHRSSGALHALSSESLQILRSSLAEFVMKYGLTRERYITHIDQPNQSDFGSFSECLPLFENEQPFSLHIRVASAMYREKLPLLNSLPYDAIRALLPSLSSDRSAALQQLTGCCSYLRPILDVRPAAATGRLEIEIHRNYVPTLFAEETDGVLYCFFTSDKIEPYIIITATHQSGRLQRLTTAQLGHLTHAIEAFKRKFGIDREQYHYTGLGERESTEAFVRAGGADQASKAHSSHFHLKMRISTAMCLDVLRVLRLVDLARMREALEPVRYNYSRESLGWDAVLALMRADALP